MATNLDLRVSPSGQGIQVVAKDSTSGLPVNIATMTNNDEQQKLVIGGNPGSTFTLSLDGTASSPITATVAPPLVYWQWNVTLGATGQYDLGVDIAQGGSFSANTTYEIFDGTTLIGTKVINQQGDSGQGGGPTNTGKFNDPTTPTPLKTVGGATVVWYPLGRFTFSGTTLKVRVSAPPVANAYFFNVDCLRVAPVGGGSVQVVDSSAPPGTLADSIGGQTNRYSALYQVAGTTANHIDIGGSGVGSRYLVDPVAVKSALEAIPAIGSGNITASGNGDPGTPVQIRFANGAGNTGFSLLVPSSNAVTATRVFAGNILPTFKVNGVAKPVSLPELRSPYYGEGLHNSEGGSRARTPYMPFAYFPFIQAAPAQYFQPVLHDESTLTGGWSLLQGATTYSPNPRVCLDTNATAIYQQSPLKAGTYRISATWPELSTRPTAVTYTVKTAGGGVLGSATTNQTLAPSGTTYGGRPFQVIGTFTLTNNTTSLVVVQSSVNPFLMAADTVLFERTSSDDSVKVVGGDAVTYSAGAGWMTTASGPAPVATDATVANLSGTKYVPDPPASGTRNMAMGWGLGGFNYYTTSYLYYNIFHGCDGLKGLAFDSDGYPTKQTNQTETIGFHVYKPSLQADGKGWPAVPPGNYVLIWDGASNLTITDQTENGTASVAGTTNKKRFYRVNSTPETYGAANLTLGITGTTQNGDATWNVDVRNVRFFPILSGVDVDNPPKFHPQYVARCAAVQCVRPMDLTSAIIGSATTWADYNRSQTAFARGNPPRRYRLHMTKIEPYVGPQIWDPNDGQPWRITTSVPHNLSDGNWITFDSTAGTIGRPTFSDGTITDNTQYFEGYASHVKVLSPTELYFMAGRKQYDFSRPPFSSTNVYNNPTAPLVADIGSPVPFADLVDLCNAANVDLHMNVTVCATDDAMTQMATYAAANLNPGRKFRVTVGNEDWNFSLGSYDYLSRETFRLGLGPSRDYVPYMMARNKQLWDICAPIFANAGRAADFVRLVEGQGGYPDGPTAEIAQYSSDHNIAFDEFAIAPYLFNGPSWTVDVPTEPEMVPLFDLMTADQLLDLYELHSVHGGWDREVARHATNLANKGLAPRIIFYEGGPERQLPFFSGARIGRRSHQTHRHPRFFDIMMSIFGMYDRSGCKLMNMYFMNGIDTATNGSFQMWSAYTGTAQLDYAPGDAGQDAIQINQYDRLDLTKSVVGGAVSTYAAGYAGTAPTNATGYTLSGSPSSVAVGSAVTITAALSGGIALSAPLVITLADSLASTVSGTITIAGGSTSGTATVTPTVGGSHAITATHTGGGFTGGDGSTSFAAIANTNATGYTLSASPSSVVTGSPVTVTATLTGGSSLSSTLTITLADSLASTVSGAIAIGNGSTAGTATITPTATGTHNVTATHVGGGFSGGDGSASFAATTPVAHAAYRLIRGIPLND